MSVAGVAAQPSMAGAPAFSGTAVGGPAVGANGVAGRSRLALTPALTRRALTSLKLTESDFRDTIRRYDAYVARITLAGLEYSTDEKRKLIPGSRIHSFHTALASRHSHSRERAALTELSNWRGKNLLFTAIKIFLSV